MSAALTPGAVDLLLTLMEQRDPHLSAAAAAMREQEAGLLVGAGFLMPDGHEDAAVAPGDDEDVPVSLFWSDTLGGLAAFSPTAGPVLVPSERLLRQRVAMPALLAAVTADLDVLTAGPPHERVEGHAWELGEIRLGRQPQRNPLWFARRLGDRAVQRQVQAALTTRMHPRLCLLLTSTRADRLDGLDLPGASVISLRDVLVAPHGLAVSSDILVATFGGIPTRDAGRPVALSPDGRTLTINGEQRFTFTSPRQVAAIRALVDAYQEERGLPVGELTHLGGPDRLFGAKRWKELKA
ncbi:hypothetical protein ACE7GA_00935 [Roseomonas sp. CCTCC AB2023176]|uniref:hypothetical protein n=1 Tax=Roseomonas sp. CCTCC AB2023176 TaxID=3342640 RepID=UPI0035E30C1F